MGLSGVAKLLSREALCAWRDNERAHGRIVVHCHGCFDIVHPGHIQHLQYARSLGDTLVVSVTTDRNVNKGFARPLIPDDLRAASLAALECVDAVHLCPEPTAVELLGALRPDIYVKGREYEHNHDPRFLAERDTVIRHGGRVVFSSGDIVYSSTSLIGRMQQTDPFMEEKVIRFRERNGLSKAAAAGLVRRFSGLKVLVIGDYILDRYHFCDASGVAGEAPVMALRALERQDYDGGAAIVASHLAAMGAEPVLVTSLADDEPSRQAELRLRASGVEVAAAPRRRQTVIKNRFLVEESKLFKVDEGGTSPLDSRSEAAVTDQIMTAAREASAVIFTDFGYGFITAGLLERVMAPLRRSVPILAADVSGRQANLLRFRGVDLLCPTEREAREALQDFGSGLGAVVSALLQQTQAKQAFVTMGKQGLVTFQWPGGSPEAAGYRLASDYLPALAPRGVDPLGCGDALLAAATLTLAAGGSLEAAAYLGSVAAAVEVQRVGNVAVAAEELIAAIDERVAAPTGLLAA